MFLHLIMMMRLVYQTRRLESEAVIRQRMFSL